MIIEQAIYNGDFIHKRFAYKFFKKDTSPCGNIVAFIAPMYVTDNLIDLEDSLSKDYIYSDIAINFCWEIPNLCPIGAVAFQRLLNNNIGSMISNLLNKPVVVEGDDIIVRDKFIGSDGEERNSGKASVSITYSQNNIAIGHTGINIRAGNRAPGFAYSTNIDGVRARILMESVIDFFNTEMQDMFTATTKVIV
jgi:hypothetical protein